MGFEKGFTDIISAMYHNRTVHSIGIETFIHSFQPHGQAVLFLISVAGDVETQTTLVGIGTVRKIRCQIKSATFSVSHERMK